MGKKRNKVIYDTLDPNTLWKAAVESFQNGCNYYLESKVLFMFGRYGRSLSMSTLGIEEIAKWWGFGILCIEKLVPGTIKKKVQLEPQEILNDLLSDHGTKHILSHGINFYTPKSLAETIAANERIWSEKDVEKKEAIRQEEQIKLNKRMSKESQHQNQWLEDIPYIKELNDRKLHGLYVDISEDGRITTPENIEAQEAKRVMELLEKHIDLIMANLNQGNPAEV